MRLMVNDGTGQRPVQQLSFMQTKQAAAIMDAFGRYIPQEGVDYDVVITFKGEANESLSIEIAPLTEKGAWWKRYASEMLKKYPPTVENPPQAIEDEQAPDASGPSGEEVQGDAEVVS